MKLSLTIGVKSGLLKLKMNNETLVRDWPDREGFWWAHDRFGLWLAESYKCKDENPESPFAVLLHAGNYEPSGPFFPSDGEGKYAWLGTSFPSA